MLIGAVNVPIPGKALDAGSGLTADVHSPTASGLVAVVHTSRKDTTPTVYFDLAVVLILGKHINAVILADGLTNYGG
ncbi:hypothetical protein LIER_31639 [Lithospermum erythrorhizon]|uniref:Uncharacterized protein n=1 Tax=Lithospermum erythrorhizon TaxID=34254 RepID=A0AAV3RWW1_LITER